MDLGQDFCSENHLKKSKLTIKILFSSIQPTQSVLVYAWMLQGRLQLDNGGLQPLGTAPIHQLSVHHGRLSVGGSVQVNHRHPLLVGPDHPGLNHLLRHQLLQRKGGDIFVICRVDIGKITLDSLS